MSQRQLLKIGAVILLGAAFFSLSHHRGSANVDLEDRKIEAFVDAAMAVESVMATWRPKIASATEEQTENLRRQANVEIRRTIDDVSGISFNEYRDIRRKIAADSDMLARVTDVMRRREEQK